MRTTLLTPLLLLLTPLVSAYSATHPKPNITLHYNGDDTAAKNLPPRFQLWSVKLTYPEHLFVPGQKLFLLAQAAYDEMALDWERRMTGKLDRTYEPPVVSVLAMGNVVYVTSDWAPLPHYDAVGDSGNDGGNGNGNATAAAADKEWFKGDRFMVTEMNFPSACGPDLKETLLRCEMGLQKVVSKDQNRHVAKATCSEILVWLQYCNDPNPPAKEITINKRLATYGRTGRLGNEIPGFMPPCKDWQNYRSTTWGCKAFLEKRAIDAVPALMADQNSEWDHDDVEPEKSYVPLC